MIGIVIGIVVLSASAAAAGYRILVGPNDANRLVGSDLLFFSIIGLLALFGILFASTAALDLVVIGTLIGFLATVSLTRALTKGRR